MRHAMRHGFVFTATFLMTVALPLAARASSSLAVDQGCYSCHGANLRGDAPGFERLAAKLAKFKNDPAAEQKFVEKYRTGEMLEHIDAHERVSPESAKALIHWLVQGGQ